MYIICTRACPRTSLRNMYIYIYMYHTYTYTYIYVSIHMHIICTRACPRTSLRPAVPRRHACFRARAHPCRHARAKACVHTGGCGRTRRSACIATRGSPLGRAVRAAMAERTAMQRRWIPLWRAALRRAADAARWGRSLKPDRPTQAGGPCRALGAVHARRAPGADRIG
jgi:hypothetical protein